MTTRHATNAGAPKTARLPASPLPAPLLAFAALALGLTAGLLATRFPRGNLAVPEPEKPVDLDRYLGLWFEIGRYENRFERGGEAVTAEYHKRPDGLIEVINTCRRGSISGSLRTATGRASVVPGSHNAKLKVRFFGPFSGNYWVLDRDDNYAWSIVGEPTGRYLWLLSRAPAPEPQIRERLRVRAAELGYDTTLIRWTQH
jgi:apolipoprotein D and lipocalin family protein